MTYLLHADVISELRRRAPDLRVIAWFAGTDGTELHLSALVIGEIRRGIERLRPRAEVRAAALEAWSDGLGREFAERVLPVSRAVADRWGRLGAGDPVPVADGLLAAIAQVHDLTLVTRDTRRLRSAGVRLLDPFAAS